MFYKSGKLLDFCVVNYDCSKKVFINGQAYKIFQDTMRYWK